MSRRSETSARKLRTIILFRTIAYYSININSTSIRHPQMINDHYFKKIKLEILFLLTYVIFFLGCNGKSEKTIDGN